MLEQLLMSLKVMVLGMGTVFVALIALIYVIELVNKIINADYNKNKKRDTHEDESLKINEKETDASAALHSDGTVNDTDEEEIIAVITAAIAASLNRSTHDIIVKSVKRVPYNTPAWNRAGRNQQIAGSL